METQLLRSRCILILLTAFLAPEASAQARLQLAESGRAQVSVITSEHASDSTKAVAAELAGYLGRISGAKFDVMTGDGSRGIVLGTLAEFPNASLKKGGLELRGTYDGREAFAIRTDPDRLLLIGGTDLGVSHAAFTLLEHLGCRWFFPSREWEVVPKQPSLSVSLDVTDRPRILARRIWYGYGPFADKSHPEGGSALKDYEAWARHNCMACSIRVRAGHAWQSIIAANKAVFAQHPEYLALVKGKRTGEQLCVSNPQVRRLATEYALNNLAKDPDAEMVSMECSDGDGQCECDECTKLGSISDRVFGLANEVAREVAKRYPGKMVGCLAYNQHSEPPSFALEPNVYVQLTAGFIRGRYTHDELLDLWPQKCTNLGFYEYFSVWLWDFDLLPGGNGANLKRTKSMIDRYVKAGATSIDAESGCNWGVHGRGYYVANKLLWNPDADVDAILADFYDKAFGPAAPAMKRYYDRVAPDANPLMSRGLIGDAFRDIAGAAELAKDHPDVLARLDALKHYLRFNHLNWLLNHTKDKAEQKQLTIDILTFAYRTRYEYMNHWNAIQTSFAGDAARKFDEPAWVRNSKTSKPWIVDAKVTQEETEKWFDEGMQYFQPTPAEELTYDYRTLAPAPLPAGMHAALACAFQRLQRFAVQSKAGEPIQLKLLVGSIAWYRDRPDARWTLNDSTDKTVAHGTAKLDGIARSLSLAVPASGVYYFECEDSGAGWRIEIPDTVAAVWLPQRGVKIISLGQMPQLYFYVPHGTRRLQYFYSGAKHKVIGPDHQLIREVEADDEIVSVDVPTGADGKCWSISAAGHSQIWLLNAPNCFAASPDAILLPKELAHREHAAAR